MTSLKLYLFPVQSSIVKALAIPLVWCKKEKICFCLERAKYGKNKSYNYEKNSLRADSLCEILNVPNNDAKPFFVLDFCILSENYFIINLIDCFQLFLYIE